MSSTSNSSVVSSGTNIKAATKPRSAKEIRVLVVDGASGAMRVVSSADMATTASGLFEPGDLLVVNDAATLPASLGAKMELDEEIELRLVTSLDGENAWTVALLGSGDYHTRTEDRPLPPPVTIGARFFAAEGIVATVTRIHADAPRLVDVELSIDGHADASLGEIWAALYRAGKPVQYAHVPDPLALWDVQNVFAGRPWAVEMPSAGRALRVETLLELQKRGVEIATVTHAAGLSSIGDPIVDAMLPLPERFEVTEETWEAIARTRRRGGRVIAIGTSAARALEGGARAGTKTGITDLLIGKGTRRAIVDAILTGVHEADTSHFALLGAFASTEVLARALARAESEGLLGHELGDACLVWGTTAAAASSQGLRDLRAQNERSGAPEGRAATVPNKGTTSGQVASAL